MKLIALLALLASTTLCFGQTLKQTFYLAEELFASGNFEKAKNNYDRVIYFDQNTTYKKKSLVRIADCYLALSMPNKAFKALDAAIVLTADEFDKNELILIKSLKLIQEKMWFRALQDLYSLKNTNIEQTYLSNYLMGVAHFGSSNFEESKAHFIKIAHEDDVVGINEIFEKAERKLNPKRAERLKTLSLFIPGSGQIIAGNAKSGVNSILLLGGLGALYFATVKSYGTFSGLITVLPWLSRYHIGGSENAEESMLKRQEKLKSRYFDEILKIVNP